jgi:hypothetical protein
MEHHQHTNNDSNYACPMHPEITGKKGDKCPKCGMELQLTTGEETASGTVTLTTSPQAIEPGMPATLRFAFRKNNQDVPLSVSHEMKLHLMIVNESLTWFRHIHPKEQPDRSFVVTETFPKGGDYFLFADYKPEGGTSAVDKKRITVKGDPGSDKVDFKPKFVSVVDDYEVTLQNGSNLQTNRTQPLEIRVAKGGKRLSETDIEPYLGATAHIAMISKDDKHFMHIHPKSHRDLPIYAETRIQKQGAYRIWVEFKTHGKVHTADFTVNVSEGKQQISEGQHDHSH